MGMKNQRGSLPKERAEGRTPIEREGQRDVAEEQLHPPATVQGGKSPVFRDQVQHGHGREDPEENE